jgi:ketosteroid isomerase-like protein
MAEENVEIVRRGLEELQSGVERGEPGAAFDLGIVVDDFEWILAGPFEGQSVWRGREGWVEFMRAWTEQFEGWSIQVERLIDAGEDRVVALTRQTAIGKGSGVPVEWDDATVSELKDGRIVRATNYNNHAEALEAAGLSE